MRRILHVLVVFDQFRVVGVNKNMFCFNTLKQYFVSNPPPLKKLNKIKRGEENYKETYHKNLIFSETIILFYQLITYIFSNEKEI